MSENYNVVTNDFQIAASLKNNAIGISYYSGLGVIKDYNKAVFYFRLAAAKGNADAQYNLGRMYLFGEGVNPDLKEVLRLFKLAADQGHLAATFNPCVGTI